MEKEIIETSKELSPIIVALIAGITGLISGAIASLISPWVHYAIESRKKSIEYKSNLIKNTRDMIDKAKDLKDIKSSSLWGFILDNLNEKEKGIVLSDSIIVTTGISGVDGQLSQTDYRKQGISMMLSRLEKEWKLTKI